MSKHEHVLIYNIYRTVDPTSCLVRYSYNNFFSVAETEVLWAANNTMNYPDLKLFVQARETLFSRLITEANITQDLVASGEERITASDKLYGLLQCTRDLNHTECNRCLNAFVRFSFEDLASNSTLGARLHGLSCFLRYETYAFMPTDMPGMFIFSFLLRLWYTRSVHDESCQWLQLAAWALLSP
jgi:Salt stress response/antifungal